MEQKDHFTQLTEFILKNEDEIITMAKNARASSAQKAAEDMLVHRLHIPHDHAMEITEEILTGLNRYNGMRHDFGQNGVQSLIQELSRTTEDMDPDKRHETYSWTLAFMKSLNGNGTQHRDITDTTEHYRNMNIKEMTDEIRELLRGDFPPQKLTDQLRGFLVSKELKELADMWPTCEEHKADIQLFMAAWAYVAQYENELKIGDTHLPPQIVGTMTGAGLDILHAAMITDDSGEGLKLWQEILKYILMALWVCCVSLPILSLLNASLDFVSIMSGTVFFIYLIGYVILGLFAVMSVFLIPLWFEDDYDNNIGVLTQKCQRIARNIWDHAVNALKKYKEKIQAFSPTGGNDLTGTGSSLPSASQDNKAGAGDDTDITFSQDNKNGPKPADPKVTAEADYDGAPA